jgi:hypothetical protein
MTDSVLGNRPTGDQSAEIVARLRDLHKQATTERSHYYVAATSSLAATEIERLVAIRNALIAELRDVVSWAATERAPLRQQEIASIRAAISKALSN